MKTEELATVLTLHAKVAFAGWVERLACHPVQVC